MKLKEGDILYLNPNMCPDFSAVRDVIDHKNMGRNLLSKPFEVTCVRNHFGDKNISIKWVDGSNWWWGQIGYDQPWTDLFILEIDYMRNKKLEELGIV